MEGYWDIHNHILPGIDDGSSCDEETFEMLTKEYEQGVRHIIFTPHFRKDMFEISPKDRINAFARVTEKWQAQYALSMPGMDFRLGCELHVHPSQTGKAKEQIYRMPGTNIVLTEFSGRDDIDIVKRILIPLHSEGYTCVVAHAERYRLDMDDIRELSQMDGVYIQCNAGSILGDEGWKQKHFVRKLLKEDLIDLIGSDAHGTSFRKVNIGDCADWIIKKFGEDYARKLLVENPQQLFQAESW